MSTVLLTGGTGFVGTFVASWLVKNTDHRIIALVRGKGDEQARRRLTSNVDLLSYIPATY